LLLFKISYFLQILISRF